MIFIIYQFLYQYIDINKLIFLINIFLSFLFFFLYIFNLLYLKTQQYTASNINDLKLLLNPETCSLCVYDQQTEVIFIVERHGLLSVRMYFFSLYSDKKECLTYKTNNKKQFYHFTITSSVDSVVSLY